MHTILIAIVAIPFVGAAAALVLSSRWAGRLALLVPALVLALSVPRWPAAAGRGETVLVPIAWFPSAGMTASLRLDHLGAFFVLLVAGVGLGIVQYSRAYLGRNATPRFWAVLLAFMGAMLAIVLSDSLLLLFVFWELTTLASFLLIGMDGAAPEARSGAIRAFLVTGAGGLSLLAGILVLGQIAGTYDLSSMPARAERIMASPARDVALLLMLVGAFTKSAQFPFHFWLPGAMAAPAPVSAFLHSATMVKAGIFLVGRLSPIFGASPAFQPILLTVGLTTFLVGGWNAVRAWDLKKLLAHSTVANLGVLTALYGIYPPADVHGGIVRGELLAITSHALYKSALFLLVGWMEKASGTRDLSILKEERWFRREPIGGVLIGIGALTMGGFPFVLGFMSKEVFLQALLDARFPGAVAAVAAAVLGGAMAVVYALKLFVSTFWGPELPPDWRGYPRSEISRWLLVVPAILLLPHVIGGIAPGWLLGSVLEPGTDWPAWFAVWHHLDRIFLLSVSTLGIGIAGYLLWRRYARVPAQAETELAFDRLASTLLGASSAFSRAAQAGGHSRYLAVMLLFGAAASAAALCEGSFPRLRGAQTSWSVDLLAAPLPAAIIAAGAVLAVLVQDRVSKIIFMAAAGYGLAVFYVLFRAPDLVLTQILVETVSLILLLLVFQRLPRLGPDERSRGRRVAHGFFAAALGLGMAVLAWASGIHPAGHPAGAEQLALSLPEAKGRNVVNVILVDFRGADTLGEITVLAVAAIGVVALRAKRARARAEEA
ncbi:hydrogen gas-evolving membrane-bound hydrogenase subunit E [Polyangium sp. y55x31]|uniref:hydrogen gas-evolving membrane-bound hydrogenase subunit E n=1 Tax=Polyangium sp. y55x31 TaxID=3042688 RepID=UPI0024822D9B|nr:hydrogen gas-evolving membrane-bound hydrogenase subunit E [Polyangium sp. y55x31]MDI1483622.1 proton-conducting transporter membrane subunit [Polyangium sp. y55x31]